MNAAARFLSDKVATATPARLLLMLFGRLELDLARAERAVVDGTGDAREPLVHAQEILAELASTLQEGTWDGAEGLRELYLYCWRTLAAPADRLVAIEQVRSVIVPIRDAWTQAEASLSAQLAASRSAGGARGVA